ncbi:MAG: alpha/beta fold hydrolase [Candidatus Woesearchaeota archaeon]
MRKRYFQGSERNDICYVLSIPRNADSVVIFTHGFRSDKNSKIYRELQISLNKKGIGTLRYDSYGCGDSEGDFQDFTLGKAVDCLNSAVAFLRPQGDYRVGLLGSSLGGLIF